MKRFIVLLTICCLSFATVKKGHGDRYIGSLFRVDEPIPDDSCRLLCFLDDFYSSFVRNPSIVPFSDEKLMPRAITLRLSAA